MNIFKIPGIFYIIFILLFISIFFLLSHLLRKINTEKKSTRLTWIGALIFTPLLFLGFIVGAIAFQVGAPENLKFTKEAWLQKKTERYLYADNLVWISNLEGKSTSQLFELLGQPDYISETIITFTLGEAYVNTFQSEEKHLTFVVSNDTIRGSYIFFNDGDTIPKKAPDIWTVKTGFLNEMNLNNE